jgi:uncharacterized protein
MTVKVGSLPNEPQKASLGARTDVLDLPLAISLGLANANGAIILDVTPGGPAGQAGVRFGDVVLSLNGKTVPNMNEFRHQLASMAPGSNANLEIWRVGADDGGFLQTLRRLADDGNADAMFRLGRLYAAGVGVERNDATAVQWFQKGAAGGNLNATTSLAVAFLEARGTARDQQEGLRLLRLAAGKDHLEAMYRLGVILAEGKITNKDTAEALRLFTKGADAGFMPAMLELAHLYNTGEGAQADPVKAATWYKRAADLGNSIGMVNLGFMYQQGRGVERNDITAVALYRKAANEGNSSGIHNLAAMLDSGRGVARKDPEQAAVLIMQALDMHNEFTLQQMTKNSRAWSPEFRRALQRKLRDAGVYSGKIDGELRDTTVTAINAYANRKR